MSLIYTLVLWLASVEINTVATIIYHFDPKHLPLFSPDMIIAGIYQVVGYTAQLVFRLYLKFKKNLCNSTELFTFHGDCGYATNSLHLTPSLHCD